MRPEIVYLVGPSLRTNGGIGYAIAQYLKSPLSRQYRLIHISTHREGNRLIKSWEFAKGLARFLFLRTTQGGRLVHIHAAYGPSFLRKLIMFSVSKCLGCRVIFQIHAGHFDRHFENSPPLTRFFLSYVLRTADALVALSESLKGEIEAVLSSRGKIHVIGNPIDTSKYRPANRMRAPSRGYKLLFLGAIIKPKGVYDIIESAKRLVREGFQINLTMAGDREIARVKQQCGEAGLDGVIRFPGWLAETQKLELLRDSDLLLLPSYTEGLPLSVMEAMACGLPVVCTAVGGLRDLVAEAENGFVIAPGDVDALTDRTARLLRNNTLRRQMGRNNVAKIKNDYGLDVIAKKIGTLYDEVLGSTRLDYP